MWEKLKGFAAGIFDNIKPILEKRSTWGILGVVAFVALVAWLLIYVPQWQVQELWQYSDKAERWPMTREMVELEAKHRAVLAQIIGGIVVLTGLYIAWRRAKAADKNAATAEQGQITERFTRAIDQLGDEKMEIRLGGIYALERIMKDSEADHWTIVEVLAAYVRKRAPWQPTKGEAHGPWRKFQADASTSTHGGIPAPAEDIQAVLTVLGRRPQNRDEPGSIYFRSTDLRRVDLRGAYLPKADLGNANLQMAKLEDANLQDAKLGYANLQEADLGNANLHKADLGNANLHKADLGNANLHKAHLGYANLQKAHLWYANLQEAKLWYANLHKAVLWAPSLHKTILRAADLQEAILRAANLQEADLEDANLQEANLEDANLQKANLEDANLQKAKLQDADLRNANELTAKQLLQVFSLYKAKLDPELDQQIRAQKPELFDDPDADPNTT